MANIIVGPILGRTTPTTSVVLVEVSEAADITCACSPEGAGAGAAAVRSGPSRLQPGRPFAFKVGHLAPGTTYTVTLEGAANAADSNRIGSLTTPETADGGARRVGVVSCSKYNYIRAAGGADSWAALAAEHAARPLTLLLHLGDQIYGDSDTYEEGKTAETECAYVKAERLLVAEAPGGDEAAREALRPRIVELYRELYREAWNHPPTAAVLRSVPSLMVPDDHEIVDDWGDRPEHRDPTSTASFIGTCGRQAFLEYQRQLSDPDVLSAADRPHTDLIVQYYGSTAVIMLDVRGAATAPKTGDAVSGDEKKLGAAQWAALREAVKGLKDKRVRTVLLASSLPLVLMAPQAASGAALVVDDIEGMWDHPDHMAERAKVLRLFLDWERTDASNALMLLGGDIHMGGFTKIGSGAGVWQLTTSPIANDTVTGARSAVARGTLGGKGTVEGLGVAYHHDQFFTETNFGVVEVTHGAAPARRLAASLHCRNSGVVRPGQTEHGTSQTIFGKLLRCCCCCC